MIYKRVNDKNDYIWIVEIFGLYIFLCFVFGIVFLWCFRKSKIFLFFKKIFCLFIVDLYKLILLFFKYYLFLSEI